MIEWLNRLAKAEAAIVDLAAAVEAQRAQATAQQAELVSCHERLAIADSRIGELDERVAAAERHARDLEARFAAAEDRASGSDATAEAALGEARSAREEIATLHGKAEADELDRARLRMSLVRLDKQLERQNDSASKSAAAFLERLNADRA